MNAIASYLTLINVVSSILILILPIALVLTPKVKLNSVEIFCMWLVFVGAIINVARAYNSSVCNDPGQVILNTGLALFGVYWLIKVELCSRFGLCRRRRKTDKQ